MKPKKIIHEPEERIYEYVSMDCYGYKIICTCGQAITGWTKIEVEERYKKHQEAKKEESDRINTIMSNHRKSGMRTMFTTPIKLKKYTKKEQETFLKECQQLLHKKVKK